MLKTRSPIAALDQVTRRSEGVRYIFGNPGTTELPLMDALIDAPDISYIWGLQEASVVAMVDGYAQAAAGPALSIFTPPAARPRLWQPAQCQRIRNAAGRDRRPTGFAAHHH